MHDAYINPTIDTSTEKFSWAIPNFVAVRDYTSEKFGWSKGKTDQILMSLLSVDSVVNENMHKRKIVYSSLNLAMSVSLITMGELGKAGNQSYNAFF